ncbi:MAG: hypothetical protein K2K02_07200 [Ruminococcus sp.]|nr:hypothetical protein [Ruminococcus sp.]
MDLLDTQMETFCYLNVSKLPDGEGGISTVWTDGAEFKANARLDNSTQAKIAEQMGVTSLYTITTKKSITLEYHEVIKRLSDGEIFRITSNGKDNKTPDSATLNMRQVSAEKWRLTK